MSSHTRPKRVNSIQKLKDLKRFKTAPPPPGPLQSEQKKNLLEPVEKLPQKVAPRLEPIEKPTAPKPTKPNNFLGQGSYGKVVRVFGPRGGYVARKSIENDYDDGLDPATIRECTMLRNFKHPNIVSIFGVEINQTNNNVDIFLPLANEDLYQFIENTADYNTRASFLPGVMYAIVSALHHIHEAKYLHRDIKPANILLRFNAESTDVWLTDFGATRVFSKKIGVSFTPGMVTYAYRAPEMKHTEYTEKSDIYSLGCTMIHLLAKKFPIVKHSTQDKTDETVPLPRDWADLLEKCPQLDKQWKNLILDMIHTDPRLRPATADIMRHPLFSRVVWGVFPVLREPLMHPVATSISSEDRKYIVDCVIWICKEFSMPPIVAYLTCRMFDRVIDKVDSNKKRSILAIAIVCMKLTIKFLELTKTDFNSVLDSFKYPCRLEDIDKMEPYVFLLCDFCIWRGPVPEKYGLNNFDLVRRDLFM